MRETRVRRRRRLIATGAGAAVLTASVAFWIGTDPDQMQMASPSTSQPASDGNWLDRAQIALAAVDSQLAAIDRTKQVWDATLAPLYPAQTPPAVQALLAREAFLQQQRTQLLALIARPTQLEQARADLNRLNDQLAALTSALAAVTPAPAAPGQLDSVTPLRSLLALAQRNQAAQAAEVSRLAQGVRSAEQEPLPDVSDLTTPLTQAVLALGGLPAPPVQQDPLPSVLAAGGPDGRRGPQQATTGQPAIPGIDDEATYRSSPSLDGHSGATIGGSDAVVGSIGTSGEAVDSTVHSVGDTAQDYLDEPSGHSVVASAGGHDSTPVPQQQQRSAPVLASTDNSATESRSQQPSSSSEQPTTDGESRGADQSSDGSYAGDYTSGMSQAEQLALASHVVGSMPAAAAAEEPVEMAQQLERYSDGGSEQASSRDSAAGADGPESESDVSSESS